jgi:ribonuclease HI
VCGDSRIVIGQVNDDLRCNQPSLGVWLEKAKLLLQQFDKVHLVHVARKYNQAADLLTRKGMV